MIGPLKRRGGSPHPRASIGEFAAYSHIYTYSETILKRTLLRSPEGQRWEVDKFANLLIPDYVL